MKILISGGSGLIGQALIKKLRTKNHDVAILSRTPEKHGEVNAYSWDIEKKHIDERAFEGVDALVHLAGAGIADSRWTDERKRVIIDSRVDSANLLYQTAKKCQVNLRAFVSASGINYYGSATSKHIFVESDPPSTDFIGKCCVKWEKAADQFSQMCRVAKLRTGVVLSGKGGALERIAKPIHLGVGAPLGRGTQWLPYIHIDDLTDMYIKALEDQNMEGAFNAVNGDHITNNHLTQAIADQLGKPLWMPNIPSFVMKVAFGEMATLLLNGSRASAKKIESAGFSFTYPNLKETLKEIYSRA